MKNGPENEQEAARRLYNWALGERAAEIYASRYVVPFYPVSLPEGVQDASDVALAVQDDEWAAANRTRLIEKWNRLIGAGRGNS